MGIKPFTLHEKFAEAFQYKFALKTIYHYTTQETAQIFLTPDKAMLYCTWAKALNDDQEYKIGIEYALAHIAEEMHLDAETASEVKDFMKTIEQRRYRMPWVMSFSGVQDKLSQWIAYTDRKRGGYALGFSFKNLENLVGNIVRSKSQLYEGNSPYILHLLPCFYLDYASKEAMSEVQHFFHFLFVEYLQEFVNKELGISNTQEYAARIASFICLFAAVIKHESFKEEQEYRLVIQLVNDAYEKEVEIIGGKPRIRISKELHTDTVAKLITEVWSSPHGDREVLNSVARYLSIKYDLKVGLYSSNVPYNGR